MYIQPDQPASRSPYHPCSFVPHVSPDFVTSVRYALKRQLTTTENRCWAHPSQPEGSNFLRKQPNSCNSYKTICMRRPSQPDFRTKGPASRRRRRGEKRRICSRPACESPKAKREPPFVANSVWAASKLNNTPPSWRCPFLSVRSLYEA
jgi:hypothetical protein